MLSVGSEQGKVFLFNGITNNLDGIFPDISDHWSDYVYAFVNRFGLRSASALADLNGDGTLEMVVGNFSGGMELLNGNIVVNQGVDVTEEKPLSLFPVPATTTVTLSCPMEMRQLRIFDVFGRRTLEIPLQGHHGEVDVKFLPEGLYLFEVQLIDGYRCMKPVMVRK